VQAREGQFHLRLDAHHARHRASGIRCLPGQVLQQRSLAHARVTAHYQSPALTGPDRGDEPVERVAFAAPARQPRRPAAPRQGRQTAGVVDRLWPRLGHAGQLHAVISVLI
jgi:hypothetical protein